MDSHVAILHGEAVHSRSQVYARVTTFENAPDGIDEGVGIFREHVLPWLRDSTGFRGSLVLLDRERARTTVMTFWASEELARSDEASGARVRDRVAAAVAARMTSVEVYEVAALERLALAE